LPQCLAKGLRDETEDAPMSQEPKYNPRGGIVWCPSAGIGTPKNFVRRVIDRF
jgi:hypothetical protein